MVRVENMVKTMVIAIDIKNPSKNKIALAARIIRKGGLVAFPTETVYGLGANALDATAVKKIFVAKGRPCDNPIIVHISDLSQLKDVVTELPLFANLLIKKFWPGPLTLVLKKSKNVPNEATGGLNTVAVRMPANKIALALINATGAPIAAPSANLSGKPSPTTVKHVIEDLNGKTHAIINGGRTKIGVESTVLDLTVNPPILLRPGAISQKQIEKVVGKIVARQQHELKKVKSPGMKYRHYAPKARIIICKNGNEIEKKSIEFKNKGKKIAILRFDKRPKEIAKNLFVLLRDFDSKGVEIILCEPIAKIKKEGIGLAVIDRLRRAARL